MEIGDLIPKESSWRQSIYCDDCCGYLDLTYCDYEELISGIRICIASLPTLICYECDRRHLPDLSRLAIIEKYREAFNGSLQLIQASRVKKQISYDLTDIEFEYDSDDYRYIPGLMRPWDDGALTPIFFNKQVLAKYDNSDEFRLRFVSTTYGNIHSKDDFLIPFGLNKNGKVMLWLGDIGKLPTKEQYYLRSENIPSDHSVGSEFYDAQIECKYTKHSVESELIHARSDFLEKVYKRYGVQIAHLEQEVMDLVVSFSGPIHQGDRERKHIFDVLNKIHVESLNPKKLGKLLNVIGIEGGEGGSLKKLEAAICELSDPKSAACIMMPFFCLYDLRNLDSHLGSSSGRKKKMGSVVSRLGLHDDVSLEALYRAICHSLVESYRTVGKFL